MRIVTVEEHFWVPSLASRIDPVKIVDRGYFAADNPFAPMNVREEMGDIGDRRVAALDTAGITVQVLSLGGPGADILSSSESRQYAKAANDVLSGAIQAHPDRFAGFAHLPLSAPDACPDELDRCVADLGFVGALVNGSTQGRFLDHPSYQPLLERASKLGVPIYLHPGLPPEAVRDAYYAGLPGNFSYLMSVAGWGWHADTAVHILRLVLSGALDRNPNLNLITGHMGEGLPAMLARFEQLFSQEAPKYLNRSVSQTLTDQLYVSTSGFVTNPPFRLLLETFGVNRILLSADYPFEPMEKTRSFLDQLPISDADREAIAHKNADRLLRLKF